MEGRLLSARAIRLARGLRGRALRARDRVLLPEATSGPEQWQRTAMMRAIDAHIAALGPSALTAAEISGANHAGRPWKRFASLDFPEFDLCAPPADVPQFDVVICEQVLEHVVDPCRAARTLHDLCVPGGRAIVSTPFLIRIHELPMYGMRDYWRFTPRGLQTLLERAGLRVDEVDTWGNRRCIAGNLDYWPAYRRWLSLRDEPDLPVQVWAYATRPA